MTKEQAIKVLQNEKKCVDRECDIERQCGKCPYSMPSKEPIINALDMAIKALSQEPCDDAISREAVLSAICDYVAFEEYEDKSHTFTIRPLTKRIKQLPSVTQKSGKWIDYSDEGFVECPFCGHATNCEDNIDELHYCFYCGAKMVEPQESSEDELKDLSKRVETLEKQINEDKEEQLKKLKAELDYAKFRCTL